MFHSLKLDPSPDPRQVPFSEFTCDLQTLVDILAAHAVYTQLEARLADALDDVSILLALVDALVILAEVHIVRPVHVVTTVVDSIANVLQRYALFPLHLTGELVLGARVVRDGPGLRWL